MKSSSEDLGISEVGGFSEAILTCLDTSYVTMSLKIKQRSKYQNKPCERRERRKTKEKKKRRGKG